MKPIVTIPNTVLSTPAKPVTMFDKRLKRLVADMKKTLIATKHPKGVGLAAPQIGHALRVFVTRPNEKSVVRVFINPEIISQAGETDGVPERDNLPRRQAGKLEGCLSIPNVWGKVKRSGTVTLRWQDESGKIHQEEFTGFMATIIQHETDHLGGILFTQRVLEQQQKLYQSTKDTEGKEILEEISI